MPFGLTNAPATFQRLMMSVAKGLSITPYLDDFIVTSSTINENLSLLKKVFIRLREANFKIKPKKCSFLKSDVNYLGFVIKNNKIFPDVNKIECIKNFAFPDSPKALRRFLGMCNFFSRFVPNYADKAKRLTSLQNSKMKTFSIKCKDNLKTLRKDFDCLKQSICQITANNLPNHKEKFTVAVDASDFAVGSVIYQKNGPIAFHSRKLSTAEQKYSTLDKEFLAIVDAVKKFHCYLYGVKFELLTDHKPLITFLQRKMLSNRQERWKIILQNYDFNISYLKGNLNVLADFASRITCPISSCSGSLFDQIIFSQKEDKEIQQCIAFLKKENLTIKHNGEVANAVLKCAKVSPTTFYVKDDVLFHEERPVVPQSCQLHVMQRFHSAGHFSSSATQKSISARYWFPKMYSKLKGIVENCACRLQKSYGHNPRPSKFPLSKINPFEVVSLDVVSMPTSRGFKYVLSIIDMKTRLLSAIPLVDMHSATITNAFLKRWIFVYGPPSAVHSDQGTQFLSRIFTELKDSFGIHTSHSSIYHPNGNSIVERVHRTLKDRLRSMKGMWSDNIDEAVFDCNRNSGAFLFVYQRTAVPKCDWPRKTDFVKRATGRSGPFESDKVAIKDRNPKTTLSPRFKEITRVKRRFGNSIQTTDGKQVSVRDSILVGKG